MCRMNLNDKSPENILVKALLIVVFSAATTAALSPEKWKTVIRNFIAGLCAGIVCYMIGNSAGLTETWLLVFCCVMSAFVSSLWPMIGVMAKKYLKKKQDDILPNS